MGSTVDWQSIGVNLRVTAHCSQGGRKYMEDMLCVAYQPTPDDKDLLYAFFGVFDGHGGKEAATYSKQHLMENIVVQKNFWEDDDSLILKAIHDGFLTTHHAMMKELQDWPKTGSGLPSTSGTTATMAFIRRSKMYIGHVGDSGLILGYQDPERGYWRAKPLTREHKPESVEESNRITKCGGKVLRKSGVPRVVWNRPSIGHQGPVRRSTPIEEIPFLAVARSLGDFWSYNADSDEFVVSPEPDVTVVDIDIRTFRCLIFGSDGLWNMLNPQEAVNSVYFAEKNNERQLLASPPDSPSAQMKNWVNPSKRLVDRALDRWFQHNLRADNTSAITVVIDPPGPPKSQVFRAACQNEGGVAVYTQYDMPKSVSTSSACEPINVDEEFHDIPTLEQSKSVPASTKDDNENESESSLGSSLDPAETTPSRSLSQINAMSDLLPYSDSGFVGKTDRQVPRTRRASLPFPLNPPIIAVSVRSMEPRRPVWTQRRRNRTDVPPRTERTEVNRPKPEHVDRAKLDPGALPAPPIDGLPQKRGRDHKSRYDGIAPTKRSRSHIDLQPQQSQSADANTIFLGSAQQEKGPSQEMCVSGDANDTIDGSVVSRRGGKKVSSTLAKHTSSRVTRQTGLARHQETDKLVQELPDDVGPKAKPPPSQKKVIAGGKNVPRITRQTKPAGGSSPQVIEAGKTVTKGRSETAGRDIEKQVVNKSKKPKTSFVKGEVETTAGRSLRSRVESNVRMTRSKSRRRD